MGIYEKTREFTYRNARPLDLARWRCHFEEGGRDAVLTALAAYQNQDGGFGHALEPDCWNPNSSPIQTWAATEVLREIGFTDKTHPIIEGILCYLAGGQDFDGKSWANTVASNNDYPHASWWHTKSESSNHTTYNPTACLVGFILRFGEGDSELHRLGKRIAGEAVRTLLEGPSTLHMDTLSCYIQLWRYGVEVAAEGAADFSALGDALKERVANAINRDTAQWETGYVCKPSRFFSSRDSVFYAGNEEIAAYECEFIQKTQLPDGSWNIPWAWKKYPEEWPVAKNWWKSDVAIKNLLYLKGMGKLV